MAQSLASDSMHSSGKLPPTLTPIGQFAGKPTLPISRSVTLIGSRKQARLQLISSTVSQNHALIVNAESGPYVRDLASRSHVLINDQEVREASLADGDELTIGRFTFRFNASPGAAPREVRHAGEGRLLVDGSDMPVPIEDRTLLIGRRETCDIHLLEKSVSTTHAIIFEIDGRRYIRDLISRTGTFVNNKQIHQVELMPGDAIRVGDTLLHYEASEATTSVAEPADLGVEHEDLRDLVELEPDEIVPAPAVAKQARPASPIDAAPRKTVEPAAEVDADSGLELIQDQPVEPEPVVAESESLQVESAEAEPPQIAAELPVELPDALEAVEPAEEHARPIEPVAAEPAGDVADELEIEPIAEEPLRAPEASETPSAAKVIEPPPTKIAHTPEPSEAAEIELSPIEITPLDRAEPAEATATEAHAPIKVPPANVLELTAVEEAAGTELSPIEIAPQGHEEPVEPTAAEAHEPIKVPPVDEPALAPAEQTVEAPAPIEIPAEFAGVEPATESPIASEPLAAPAPEPGIPPAPIAPPGVMSIDQAKLESEPLIAAGNEPAPALQSSEVREPIEPEASEADVVAPPIAPPIEPRVEPLAKAPIPDSAMTAPAKVEKAAAPQTPIAPIESEPAQAPPTKAAPAQAPPTQVTPTQVTPTQVPPTKAPPAPPPAESVKSRAKKKSPPKKSSRPIAPAAAVAPIEPIAIEPVEPVEPIEPVAPIESVLFDQAANADIPIAALSFDAPAPASEKPAVDPAEIASIAAFDAGEETDLPVLSEEELAMPPGDVIGGDFALTDEAVIDSPLELDMAIDQPLDVDDVFTEQAADLDLGLESLPVMDEMFAPGELESLPDFEADLQTPEIASEPLIDLAAAAPPIDQPAEQVDADQAEEAKQEDRENVAEVAAEPVVAERAEPRAVEDDAVEAPVEARIEPPIESPVEAPIEAPVDQIAPTSSEAVEESPAEVIAATEATPESALAIDEAVAPIDEAGESQTQAEEIALSDTGFGRAVEAFTEPSTGAIVEEPTEKTVEAESEAEPHVPASAQPTADDIELLPVEAESDEPSARVDEPIIDVESEDVVDAPVESKVSEKLFNLEPPHEPAPVLEPPHVAEPVPSVEVNEQPEPKVEEPPAEEIELEPVEASFGPIDVTDEPTVEAQPPTAEASAAPKAHTSWDEDLDLEAMAAESAQLPKVQSRFGPGASQLDFEPLTDAELGLNDVEVKRGAEVQTNPPRSDAAPVTQASEPQAPADETSLDHQEFEASLDQVQEVEAPAATESPDSTQEISAEEVPAEEISAEVIPAEEISAEETPAEEIPATEPPAEELTPLEVSAEEIVLEEVPTETPAEQTASALAEDESPAPVAEAPVPEAPVAEAPAPAKLTPPKKSPAPAPVDRPSEPGDASYNWGANQEHFLGGMPLKLPPPPRRPQPAATANPMPLKTPPAPVRPMMRKPAAPQPRPVKPEPDRSINTGFDGLVTPAARNVDVFSQGSSVGAGLTGDVFGGATAGGEEMGRAHRGTRSDSSGDAWAPVASSSDAEQEAQEAQPPPRRGQIPPQPPPIGAPPPRKKRRWFGFKSLLLLIVLAAAACTGGIYALVPARTSVTGTLKFVNFDALTRRNRVDLAQEQASLLSSDVVRVQAEALMGSDPASAGFLADPVNYLRMASAGSSALDVDRGVLAITYGGHRIGPFAIGATQADRARMLATLNALYAANQKHVDEAVEMKKTVEGLKQACAESAEKVESLGQQIEQAKAAAQRPDLSERTQLQADAAHKESDYQAAAAKVASLAAEIFQLKERQARPTTQPDAQLDALQADQKKLEQRMLAIRDRRASQTQAARTKLDSAIDAFNQQIDASGPIVKDHAQLTAYLAGAQKMIGSTRELTDQLMRTQEEEYARLSRLKSELNEKMASRPHASGQHDAQLDQLQKVIDQQQQELTENRKLAMEKLDVMQATFLQSQPAAAQLTPAQQQFVADLNDRLGVLSAARTEYAQVSDSANKRADDEIRTLQASLTDLASKIDQRKREIASQAPPTTDEPSDAIEAKSKQLADAQHLRDLAETASIEAKKKLSAVQAQLDDARSAGERRDALIRQRDIAQQELSQRTIQLEEKKSHAGQIAYPAKPTDASVSFQGVDQRPIYSAVATACAAIFLGILRLVPRGCEELPEDSSQFATMDFSEGQRREMSAPSTRTAPMRA